MNLRGRVDALFDRLRPARLIVVLPGDGPPVRETANRTLVLHVPGEHEGDPKAGLTRGQRALIGRDDQLVVVKYEDRAIHHEDREEHDHEPDDAA